MKTKPLKFYHGIIMLAAIILLLFFAFSYAQFYLGLWGMVITQLGIAVVVVAFVFIFKADPKSVFVFKLPKVKHFFGSLLLWLGTMLITSALNLLLMKLFPQTTLETTNINNYVSSGGFLLRIVAVAVLPGICEELMHRGFIFAGMQNSIKNKLVLVLTMGAIFGLFHVSLFRFLTTAILGVALTYMRVQGKTLILPMFFHFLNNSLSVFASGTTSTVDVSSTISSVSLFLVLFYISLGLIPVLFGMILLRDEGKTIKILPIVLTVVTSFILFVTGLVGITIQTLNTPAYEINKTVALEEKIVETEDVNIIIPYAYDYKLAYNGKNYTMSIKILDANDAVVFEKNGSDYTADGEIKLTAGHYTIEYEFAPIDEAISETVKYSFSLKTTISSEKLSAKLE